MATRLVSAAVLFAVVAFSSTGCTSAWMWNDAAWWDEDESTAEGPSEETLAELRKKAKRVGDLTYPWNLNVLKVEGVALVTELAGTGASPPADHMRETLRKEMQTHKVLNPDKLLSSDRTALVLVEGWLPPAARRGDTIDVKVVSPKGYETTSLEGGWLMSTRLRPMAYLKGQTHEGDVLANAEGSTLTDSIFEREPRDSQKLMGRVLGGGEIERDREIGLQIRSPDIRATHAMLVAKAINSRFSAQDGTRKVGAAVAKDNKIISLNIPANYRTNLFRFMEVVAAIPVNESAAERTERLQLLGKQLLEPSSAGRAAIALEAAGKDAVALLEQGLGSPRPEVTFYAAEALAYMDEKQGVETLREAAKNDDRFRWHAIAALSSMTHIEAYEALSDLLQSDDAQTRYGAFLALRVRNSQDPFIPGEKVRDEFHFHIVTSLGAPVVHFSRRQRAEIVIFGHDQRIENLQKAVFPGKTSGIMLKPLPGGRVLVTRFAANKEDRRIETSGELVETMKAVIEVGGSYQELLTMAQALHEEKAWSGELVIDALPMPTRGSGYNVADANAPDTPFPNLFDPEGHANRRDAVSAEKFDPSMASSSAESGEASADEESATETAAGSENSWSWLPSWN